ncbi:1,4-dihydroxy-2-naphthoate octaprenyltransferase [Spirochaetota bacterium]|nr:1,4-dihydroxy-2-naphthoate octaprenyltransferase [Spirochaetota bacterium]
MQSLNLIFRTCYIWFTFTRPKTLIASIMPIVSAVPIAAGYNPDYSLLRGSYFLGIALLLQIACNFNNDYYDFRRGSDRSDRIGPKRVLQLNLVKPIQVKYAIFSSFGLALILMVYLAVVTHYAVLIVGVISVAVAYWYTGGNYPLAYHGWGEVAAFVFFGPVIVYAAVFIMAGTFIPIFFPTTMIAISYGFFAYMLIAINNLRDVTADKTSRKQTLTVRYGRVFTVYSIYASLVWIAIMTALLGYYEKNNVILYGIPVLTVIGGFFYLGNIGRYAPARLNNVLGRVGVLMTAYTGILTITLFMA